MRVRAALGLLRNIDNTMGNLCGKESTPDPFARPGRTLSSAPIPSNSSSVPDPKTVGDTFRSRESRAPTPAGDLDDARRKAAEAAEARAKSSSKVKGKLASTLYEQKKQTQTSALENLSRDERRAREVDEMARAQAYN